VVDHYADQYWNYLRGLAEGRSHVIGRLRDSSNGTQGYPQAMVIEISEKHKRFRRAARSAGAHGEGERRREGGAGRVYYAAQELELSQRFASAESEAQGVVLRSLEVDAPRVLVDGKEHSGVGRAEATYCGMGCPARMERALQREVGVPNAKTVDAVSLHSEAVEGDWLPQLAMAMAYVIAQGTSHEARATTAQLERLPYLRSSFERIGHEVGKPHAAVRIEIEQALIEASPVPEETRSVSVSLDRVRHRPSTTVGTSPSAGVNEHNLASCLQTRLSWLAARAEGSMRKPFEEFESSPQTRDLSSKDTM
jgi:hypothetical protein